MQNEKDFYKKFEDRYRGSRELIKNRVAVYLPFILLLKDLYPQDTLFDIGCGRGEWLELLNENNIAAKGVDIEESMLTECLRYNLDVAKIDAISFLKSQQNESAISVTALHVVEHIPFRDLKLLIKESLRVLKPGGILILETPNVENLKVASESFYLDPTHTRPVPSELLSFLTKFYDFSRTKILKLQEPQQLADIKKVTISHIIEGVSPDYAVVAQKSADRKVLQNFDELFMSDHGLSLKTLLEKFEERLLKFESKTNELELKTNELELKTNELELNLKNNELAYMQILNSNSWKLTKPLRILKSMLSHKKENK